MRLHKLFPLLFVIGVLLMVPFDYWYTRLAGMGCLVAFVIVGLFVIASPEFLARGSDDAVAADGAGGAAAGPDTVATDPPAADQG
ncbi:MAG: hypothetical protein JWP17_1274 [Solirubrobacterales bacterium]|jgi:hypothetical protein|nr:hypothetical protein [Solirubrobacterales bacterium]